MMAGTQERFFLFIGAIWTRETGPNKLQASRIPYRWKRLDSSPGNWEAILGILQDPSSSWRNWTAKRSCLRTDFLTTLRGSGRAVVSSPR